MTTPFSPELEHSIRRHAAQNRLELETKLSRKKAAATKISHGVMHLIGSLALAVFSAGMAIFSVAVLLNLIFHFSPS